MKLLSNSDPGTCLSRSRRLAVSPDMAVQSVDQREVSSKVRKSCL